jgi:hypothetical protein
MIKCANCNGAINEPCGISEELRKPCPQCGSLGRHIEKSLHDTINLDDRLSKRFKHIDPSLTGKERVRLDEITGEQLNRGSGKWVQKEWWIDRDHNPPWYYERITDIDTGEVLRICSQPLSEHRGRGSAKTEGT